MNGQNPLPKRPLWLRILCLVGVVFILLFSLVMLAVSFGYNFWEYFG